MTQLTVTCSWPAPAEVGVPPCRCRRATKKAATPPDISKDFLDVPVDRLRRAGRKQESGETVSLHKQELQQRKPTLQAG